MAGTDYSAFESFIVERLASGPLAYNDLFAAARLEGFEAHMAHLRTMAASGAVKFRLEVVDGQPNHTVELIPPELPF